jgi:hypothetical protein
MCCCMVHVGCYLLVTLRGLASSWKAIFKTEHGNVGRTVVLHGPAKSCTRLNVSVQSFRPNLMAPIIGFYRM